MLENAVIIAGGKSSRMGEEDKALLPFGGYDSMAEYQYRRLKKIFKNVYISTKENKFNFDANLIIDSSSVYSPMVAIESILSTIKDDIFLLSVDMPLLSFEAIEKLRESYHKNSSYDLYVLESPNSIEPTAAIYTKKVLPKIREYIDKDIHKLNSLIKSVNNIYIFWNINEDFLNINDIKTYKYLLSRNK